ncbi:hypothetical protein ACAG39_02875 [Caldicellulosiruptoraceae bacterium PP1]
MDNINSNEIIFNNISKILFNIIDNTFENKTSLINGKILTINKDQLTISTNGQVITALNTSDLNFEEGQDILLKLVDIRDGKYIYKVLRQELSINSKVNKGDIKIINNNLTKIDIPKIYFNNDIFETIDSHDLIEVFIKNNNNTISMFFDNNLVEQIKYNLPFDYQGPALLKFDNEIVSIIFNSNDSQQKIINLFKNVNVEIKNNIDMYTAYGLVIDKKPIIKEEFINEKNKFLKYIKNIDFENDENKSLLHLLSRLKNNSEIKSLSDVFLLYKIKDEKIKTLFIKDERNDVLENNIEKGFIITKDNYNYYILNNQNIVERYNGNINLVIKENNKKRDYAKIESIAVMVNTDNLGKVSFYVKKMNNRHYNVLFLLENFEIYNYFNYNKNILLEMLRSNNKEIRIEYRISKNCISNLVIGMMIDNNEISKIDLKV